MLKNPLNSGKNMFAGDTTTQIWARDVLPLLYHPISYCRMSNNAIRLSK